MAAAQFTRSGRQRPVTQFVTVPTKRYRNTNHRCGADNVVRPKILLISGSLRHMSSNTGLLRTAVEVAPDGVDCLIYDRLAWLPAFNPDDDHHPLPAEVQRLRDAIHESDAIIFSTPEYAGALPGSLKNLLDWAIGDEQIRSIYDKPVGWANASPRGANGAHSELRTVLSYAHARIIDKACAQIPVTPRMVGPDGLIDDGPSRSAILEIFNVLLAATTPDPV